MGILYEYSYFLLFIIFHFTKMKYFWAFNEDYENSTIIYDCHYSNGDEYHRV